MLPGMQRILCASEASNHAGIIPFEKFTQIHVLRGSTLKDNAVINYSQHGSAKCLLVLRIISLQCTRNSLSVFLFFLYARSDEYEPWADNLQFKQSTSTISKQNKLLEANEKHAGTKPIITKACMGSRIIAINFN